MNKEELEFLLGSTDSYVQKIFDAVSPLNRVDFLHQVYDFRNTIEKRLADSQGLAKVAVQASNALIAELEK